MKYTNNSTNLIHNIIDDSEDEMEVVSIPQLTAIVALNCMVNIIALVVDISVFIGIIKANFQKRLKIFLANMTLVDLFSSVVLQPIFSATLILQIVGHENLAIMHKINASLWYFIFPISLLALTAVSIERYILIYHPLRSEAIISANIAVGVSIFIWMLSIILRVGILFYTSPALFETVLNAAMLLIVLGLMAIHLRIFITAKTIRNQVNSSIPGQPVDRRHAEIKLAAITTGMFITILISYPPYLIKRLVIQTSENIEVSRTVEYCFLLFITISTVLKQLLLGILNKDVRSRIIRQWRIFQERRLTRQESGFKTTSAQSMWIERF